MYFFFILSVDSKVVASRSCDQPAVTLPLNGTNLGPGSIAVIWNNPSSCPASILRKSTSGRHRPVSYPDGPMTVRYRFT